MTRYMSVVATLYCDAEGCDESYEVRTGDPGSGNLRREAGRSGWAAINKSMKTAPQPIKDYCPKHAPEHVRR